MLVLVTGAAGRVASMTLGQLAKRYKLRLTDRQRMDPPWNGPFYQADITDRGAMTHVLDGVDVLIHLAAQGYRSTWPELWTTNLIGFHNILKSAAKCGCRRVIFASTIQVVDGYPEGVAVSTTAPPYPINSYGLSKAIGETMAHTATIRDDLSVLCVRLGSVTTRKHLFGTDTRWFERVITADDLGRLWMAAIEADQALDYGIFHGLSANKRCRLDLRETIQTLDYQPVDDAFEIAQRNNRQITYKIQTIIRRIMLRMGKA